MKREIAKRLNQALKVAKARAQRLSTCGGCDPKENHFCNAVIYAALIDTAQDYFPLSTEGRKAANNLLHF